MLGSHNFNEATLVRAWRLATETPVGAEARLLQRSHARESVETFDRPFLAEISAGTSTKPRS